MLLVLFAIATTVAIIQVQKSIDNLQRNIETKKTSNINTTDSGTKSTDRKIVLVSAAQSTATPPPAPVQATPVPVVVVSTTPVINSAKMFIYMHESGNRPGAINASSGACGLGQALPCSKMSCNLSDYACQDSFFTSYMLARYGSWENAMAFWIKNSWW